MKATKNKEVKEINDQRDAVIDVINYTKKFKKFLAAKDVNFSVGHGKIHGFIGPNGSGKTTVIKAMIGAYIPTSGEIDINGHKAGSVEANEFIGYIPERASFPKHLNTTQYLKTMGKQSGLKTKEAKLRAKKVLEDLGLQEHSRRKPIKFSSGMQKKILLAQSLMTNPSVLILDEPAANLDPTARKELFDQLLALRDQGKTILISSHILAELERLVDEVTFIYYGEVIYSGDLEKFTESVSDVYIKSKDNKELAKWLRNKGYVVAKDINVELQVRNVARKDVDKLIILLPKSKISLLSIRSNDLQSVYDKLILESEQHNRGQQLVGDKKAIAMNKNMNGGDK